MGLASKYASGPLRGRLLPRYRRFVGRSMKSGRTIGNKQTGETLTMLTSEEDSGGALQYYRVHLPPHRASPPLHYHLAFKETFTCLEGALAVYLGKNLGKNRKEIRLHPGEKRDGGDWPGSHLCQCLRFAMCFYCRDSTRGRSGKGVSTRLRPRQ